jgi:hypothetical protein
MTMPAGEYIISDLCYVMHPDWSEVCDILFSHPTGGEFKLSNGVRFAIYNTKYGDGSYFDDEGNEYSVDAGVIGCILLSDINDPDKWLGGGYRFEFDEEFETFEKDGKIVFGGIVIDTDPVWLESEYYDDEDYDFRRNDYGAIEDE